MHIKKKIAALALAVSALTAATAGAEQAKAEEYRQMFASGNFYVKYGIGLVNLETITPGMDMYSGGFIGYVGFKYATKDKYKPGKVFVVAAGKDGNRMKGIFGKALRAPDFEGNYTEILKDKKAPDVMFKNGKYYRVRTSNDTTINALWRSTKAKSVAYMLPAEKLDLPTLDPDEGWNHIRKDLALPDELAIFCWHEPYRGDVQTKEAPRFQESNKQMLNGIMYDCDQYVAEEKSASGNVVSREIYRALYENGKLVYIQKFSAYDGTEVLTGIIDIREISAAPPENVFEFPAGTNIYAADEGKMYDLLGNPLLLEKTEKQKKQKEDMQISEGQE